MFVFLGFTFGMCLFVVLRREDVASARRGCARWLIAAVVLGAAVSLAACGGGENKSASFNMTIGHLAPLTGYLSDFAPAAGKAADLAAFSLEGWRGTPNFAPESALLFALAGRPARHVLIAGRELVRDGRLLSDVSQAISHVTASGGKLHAWSQASSS